MLSPDLVDVSDKAARRGHSHQTFSSQPIGSGLALQNIFRSLTSKQNLHALARRFDF
jgi:hypothetical protein